MAQVVLDWVLVDWEPGRRFNRLGILRVRFASPFHLLVRVMSKHILSTEVSIDLYRINLMHLSHKKRITLVSGKI